MIVNFHKDGTVRHPHTDKVIGGWSKEPRPSYVKPTNKEHVFKVWKTGDDPQEAKGFFPRYMANRLFDDDEDKFIKLSGRFDHSANSWIFKDADIEVRSDTPGYYTLIVDGQESDIGDVDDMISFITERRNASEIVVEL